MIEVLKLPTWLERYMAAILIPPADYLSALDIEELRAAHALAIEAHNAASVAATSRRDFAHADQWLPFVLTASRAERAYSEERIRRLTLRTAS